MEKWKDCFIKNPNFLAKKAMIFYQILATQSHHPHICPNFLPHRAMTPFPLFGAEAQDTSLFSESQGKEREIKTSPID
jgi:hypothetical protein